MSGSWSASDDCVAAHRGNAGTPYYVWYYTFTLAAGSRVTIDLSSSVDTYLFLLTGHGSGGAVRARNDDADSSTRDSRLVIDLPAGDYTIEATTFRARTEGSFTLTVDADLAAEDEEVPEEVTVTGLEDSYDATVDVMLRESFTYRPADAEITGVTVEPDGLGLTVVAVPVRGVEGLAAVGMAGTPDFALTYEVTLEFTQSGRVDTRAFEVVASCHKDLTRQVDGSCGLEVAVSGLEDSYDATEGKRFRGGFTYEPAAAVLKAAEREPKRVPVTPDEGLILALSAGSRSVGFAGTPTLAGAYDAALEFSLLGRTDTIDFDVAVKCPGYERPQPDRSCAIPVCTTQLGTGAITAGTLGPHSGTWVDTCLLPAGRRDGSRTYFANHYKFTLNVPAIVTIDLTSSADTYLFLLSGHNPRGAKLRHDDDGGEGYNSRLASLDLAAGHYTIAASTYRTETTGSYKLTLSAVANCPTGQQLVGDSCIRPLEKLDMRHHSSIVPQPAGHRWTNSCFKTELSGGVSVYTCRRIRESRRYIGKTSDEILETSDPYATHGTTLVLDSEELLEGCQSVSSDYWQCDYRSDLVWHRRTVGANVDDYLYPAFTRGVRRPAECAYAIVEMVATRDPSALTSVVNACLALLEENG